MGGFGSLTRKNKVTYSKVEYEYMWTITNFRSVSRGIGNYGESVIFKTGQNNQYSWTLDIYPDGCDDKHKNYVSIRVYLYDKEKHNGLKFSVEASVLDEKGQKQLSKKLFISQGIVNTSDGVIKDFVLRSSLLNTPELLPRGELRILCVIDFDDYIDRGIGSDVIEIQRSHDAQAVDFFAKLFNNEQFSDFTLIVGVEKFHVHRAILSARSRVFEKMFTSVMKEGEITIDDVGADVMETLLYFVYVDRIDDISDEMAKKLLIAANKYEIEMLRLTCEELLVNQLNVDNVYEILLLAHMHNASKMKTKAIEFLRMNSKTLATAEGFDAKIRSLPVALQSHIICTFMSNF